MFHRANVIFLAVLLDVFGLVANERVEESWGYHLILDCKGGDIQAVTDPQVIQEFVVDLVDQIEMKRFGDPIIVHFGSDHVTGYSLMQLIETSSITGHFVDHNGDAYIDVFSCKPFDQEVAMKVVKKYFNPKKMKVAYLTRQA